MTRACIHWAALAAVGLVGFTGASCRKPEGKSVGARAHQINNAAFWNGALWFAETEGKVRETSGASAKTWLIRLAAGPGQSPERLSALDVIEPWFVAGTDRLWILSSEAVAYYQHGKIASTRLPKPLGEVSRPFLYDGAPALIASESPGYRLRVWKDGKWQPMQPLRMKLPNESDDCSGQYLQAFQSNGTVHVFCQVPLAAPVYYHRGLPLAEAEQRWQKVADAGGQWKAAGLGGHPAMFFHADRDGLVVLGLIRRGAQWDQMFSRGIGLDIGLGVCPTGQKEDFILLRRMFPLGIKILAVKGGQPAWAYEGKGKINLVGIERR